MRQNSRTQTVIKLLKKCDNLKDQIVTKLNNSNSAKLKKKIDNSKTQNVIVIKVTVVTEVVIMTSCSKTPKHLYNRPTLRAAFHNSCDFYTCRVNLGNMNI